MATLILDTDISKADGVTTFSTMADVLARINATHGTYFSGKGAIEVQLRASTGLPLNEEILIDQFVPTEADNLILKAYRTNGYPFKLTDVGLTQTYLVKLADDYVYLEADQFGDLILEADATGITDKAIVSITKATCGVENAILNGGGSARIAGVYSTVTGAYARKSVITGCNRPFFGACRGPIPLDHCTISDSVMLRQCGAMTNSIVINTPLNTGDGLPAGTNYNIYDVAQSAITYASGAAAGDVNSHFSVSPSSLVENSDGTFDIPTGSALASTDSTGGNIGANTQVVTVVVVDNPPVASDATVSVVHNSAYTAVDLSLLVTDDHNAIDWLSLRIISPVHGNISIDAENPHIAILDYSGTDYSGADSFTFNVSDTSEQVTNTGTVTINVQASGGASAAIAGNSFARGIDTTITMTNYTPALGVDVFVKDTVSSTEYKCTVVSHSSSAIVFNAPLTVPALAAAQIIVKPITAWV